MCTSMCEPAENDGSGLPSTLASSKLQMSSASTVLRVTRTRSTDGAFIAPLRGGSWTARACSGRLRCRGPLGRDQPIDHLARLHAAGVGVQLQQVALWPA